MYLEVRRDAPRAVAAAIIGCTEVRAALEDAARYEDVRLARVKTRFQFCPARVLRNAARLEGRFGVARGPVIRRPLPDIADHVVQTETVGRITADWACPIVAFRFQAIGRKNSLPRVGHSPTTGCQFFTPCEFSVDETASCCKLPFRLGWQFQASPIRVCHGIALGDMDHRVIELAAKIAQPP